MAEWKVGDTVDGKVSRYRIDEAIGGGAQQTFKAIDLTSNQTIFLKIYADEPKKTNPRFNVFLNQQHEIYRRLDEINTVTEILYEDFLIDDLYYCAAKEFVLGKNLESLIEEDLDTLTEDQLLGLAVVFIGVLKLVHDRGVIHTDLKPAQIFVSPDSCQLGWALKLKDFDAAHVPGVEYYNVVGTQFYFSPEHLQNKEITFKSDVFTAGIVLGEMLTGAITKVFDVGDEDDGSKYKSRVLGHEVNEEVLSALKKMYIEGGEVAQVILQMLDPDPSNRPDLEGVHKTLFSAFKSQKGTSVGIGTGATEAAIPQLLKLKCDGNYVSVLDSMKLGRDNFRIFGKEKYKYCDKEQFSVEKRTDGWYLVPVEGVTNSALLNGESITEPTLLQSGNIIQIGPLSLEVEMR